MKPFSKVGLKRKPDMVTKGLSVSRVGNTLVAKEDLRILFPSRYVTKGMVTLGSSVYALMQFAILNDKNEYTVSNAPARMELLPSITSEITIDDTPYQELLFNAGDVVTPNLTVVQDDSLIYLIFDEILIQGKIPWYFELNDLISIYALAPKYAGTSIGKDPLAIEILAMITSRDPEDNSKMFRVNAKLGKDMHKKRPYFIGLQNINYAYTSTIAKIGGSYFKPAVTSALVNPEKSMSNVEKTILA